MEYVIGMIAVASVVTIIIRFLPFWAFGGKKKIPAVINDLGRMLPSAIMVILVIYCLKGVNLLEAGHGIPELLSVLVVALLHIWKKNTLLSIAVGTICYMVLIQAVF